MTRIEPRGSSFTPELRRAHPLGKGAPADGDQDPVAFHGLAAFQGDPDPGREQLDLLHAHLRTDLEALLAEDRLGSFEQVGIQAGEDRGRQFQEGDFGTEAEPDGTQLQTDDAGADHHQVAGHFRQRERAGG